MRFWLKGKWTYSSYIKFKTGTLSLFWPARPQAHNPIGAGHLEEHELRRMKLWYVIGGIGFVLSVAGGLAAMAGLLMSR